MFNRFVINPLKRFFDMLIASTIVAVLMGCWTYLFAIYQNDDVFLSMNWMPFFIKTIWIPFSFVGLIVLILYYFDIADFKSENQIKKSSFISIFVFSVYFVILSFLNFSPDYYVLSFAGLLFFFLSFFIKFIRRNCKVFSRLQYWCFNGLLFLFPAFTLIISDYFLYEKKGIVFYSLFALVAYIPGLIGLTFACLVKKYVFKDLDCKYLFSFSEVVFIIYMFNLLIGFYLMMPLGGSIFYVCVSLIAFLFLCTEFMKILTKKG